MNNIVQITGGVTAPQGFLASGLACGLKKSGKPDLALVYSDPVATGAAVFTTNKVKAAPVLVSREHLSQQNKRAVIINSANANACVGPRGMADTLTIARALADLLQTTPDELFLASTGVIGVPLPVPPILAALSTLKENLSAGGGTDAARAIMTTDTFPKEYAVAYQHDGREIRIGGMAKGSGMIQPNMATMLAVLTTDAPVPQAVLQQTLRAVVDRTFNRITVDGDTSTNDSVFLLANGAAGGPPVTGGPALAAFTAALEEVCRHLAWMIVQDGEGATKFITVRVTGARTEQEAETAARAVANSPLVKTAFYGEDANWGRILAAVGYSGIDFAPEKTRIRLGELLVYDGAGLAFDEAAAKRILQEKAITTEINLNQGEAAATIWTCDLSQEYVRINGSYRS
ncbi:MAG TPA: bifunctional glutamate N-acetyltransferase/amino-acid acetyltransferase ArgJ [Firmicutes bacterium]|nr:bifunctional glutamate N-acetyltransferase/amino-acid acetyltransferase ArgJ [Bacillota bacterium]